MAGNETKQCQNCKSDFVIEPDDFAFYEKMQVPPPTWCPECRLVRRLVLRNERALYKRVCGLCGEVKILMYSPESPYVAYCYPCWWSDRWTASDYARDYDPTRPFLEQFGELLLAVPRPGIIKQGNHVGSEYNNRATDLRNCYLVFGTNIAEYCRYGVWFNYSKECIDGYSVQKCERCYECIDCLQCYNLNYGQECSSCTDSWFLVNCTNCQNCFGCVNLRNKSYCIFNEQYTKEEYQKIVAGYALDSAAFVDGMRRRFDEFRKRFIVPSMVTHRSSNATGNWVENSKNIHAGFNVLDVEDGRYLFGLLEAKDVMDYAFWGRAAERVYDAVNCGIQVANVRFANECWNQARDLTYVMNCHSSHDLFGCVGIKNGQYRILNKQYTKEAYRRLVREIIGQMDSIPYVDQKGRRWGFGDGFPPDFGVFAYNETLAQEFFPLTKAMAEAMGFRWRDEGKKDYQITVSADALPDVASSVDAGIVGEVIGCAHAGTCNQLCTTTFKITSEDLQRYCIAKLPLPRLCPNCRHFERLARRNPIRLWQRRCQCAGTASDSGVYANLAEHRSHDSASHCPNEFETSYSPDHPEIVYCRACYEAEIV